MLAAIVALSTTSAHIEESHHGPVEGSWREVETETRKVIRELDGHDLGDDIGNAGDEVRKDLGNFGDDLRREGREVGDKLDEDLHDATNTPR